MIHSGNLIRRTDPGAGTCPYPSLVIRCIADHAVCAFEL